MKRVTLVRYAAKPDRAEENERLSRAVFDELKTQAPGGVSHALFRDGSEFLHLFVNFNDDDSSPVTELPTFKTFSRDIAARCDRAPETTRFALELVESYGFSFAPQGVAGRERAGAAA